MSNHPDHAHDGQHHHAQDGHDHHDGHAHGGHEHHEPRPWSRIKTMFRPERKDLTVVLIYALFVALLSLATPIAVQAMVSTIIFGVVIWPIIWLALILFICLALAGVIHTAESFVIEVLQRRLFVRTVADFAQILPRVKLESFDKEYGPSIVNRFFDIVKVQKSAATLLLDAVGIILATVIGMAVLAVYHPILLAFDVALIFALVVIVLAGRGGIKADIAESQAKFEIGEWLQELARIPRSFKTGYGPALAMRKADELATRYLADRKRSFAIVQRQFILGVITQVLANVALLGLGGYLVMERQLTAGQLIAAELIIALVVGSLLKLNKYLDAWYGLCTGLEKLAHVTDLPTERETGDVMGEPNSGMRLSVSDVSYQTEYRRFDGISWRVEPNEKVALTGKAGTGKSVLLDVIAGLREPTTGHIELDGFDLRDLQLDSVRRQVAIVRGVEIFSGTIGDNIRLGREYLTLHELRDALQAVQLPSAVQSLPDGMQTILNQDGQPLSQSQALRICIARAIVGKPRLLILDGILDDLDTDQFPEMMDTLFAPNAPWTLVVVTRNEKVVNRCTRVIGLNSVPVGDN